MRVRRCLWRRTRTRAGRRSQGRKKVVFSGVGKTAEELTAALKAGILLFNVESESELWTLAECAARRTRAHRLRCESIPDVAAETHPYISTGLRKHKFGVPIREARALYAEGLRCALSPSTRGERAHRLADHRRRAVWRIHGTGS